MLACLGHAYAKAGRRDEAFKLLAELLQYSEQGHSVSGDIAWVYYGLGDEEKTFEWLERALEEQSYSIAHLKANPIWDGLRSDPRFIALLKEIRLAK